MKKVVVVFFISMASVSSFAGGSDLPASNSDHSFDGFYAGPEFGVSHFNVEHRFTAQNSTTPSDFREQYTQQFENFGAAIGGELGYGKTLDDHCYLGFDFLGNYNTNNHVVDQGLLGTVLELNSRVDITTKESGQLALALVYGLHLSPENLFTISAGPSVGLFSVQYRFSNPVTAVNANTTTAKKALMGGLFRLGLSHKVTQNMLLSVSYHFSAYDTMKLATMAATSSGIPNGALVNRSAFFINQSVLLGLNYLFG